MAKNSDYVIHITTSGGRTWSHVKEGDAWERSGPDGQVHRMTAEQLLSHLLPPLAGDQPDLSVSVERRAGGKPRPDARPKRSAKGEEPATLSEYAKTIDAGLKPMVVDLHRAILAARPDLDVAIKYRMLSYALDADFRHWVCAIDARREKVSLRFLYGAQLSAPPGTLRRGSTTMGTIDFTSRGQIDARLVAGLVEQAVVRLGEVKAAESKRRR